MPAAPRDTYAEAMRPDSVVLTWKSGSDPAPPLELYAVYRDGVKIGEVAEPRFEDQWLLAGKTYQYVVRAVGTDGESADSPPARITTPPSRAFEIGPYLQQLTATGAAVVWQTYDPATTALAFGAGGRAAAGGRARRDAHTPACRAAAAARAGHRLRVPLGVRRQAG